MAAQHPEGTRRALAPDFEDARLQLARLYAIPGATLRQAWVQLGDLVARTMQVERVGVWLLVDAGRAIRCRYLLQRSSHEVFQGAVLRAADFPSYFHAMDERRTIAADDALNAGTTRELRAAYLDPLGITSMLDAPIYFDGRVVGVICHEHVGPKRVWTDQERDFAGAAADNIARLYGEHERQHAEKALHAYQQHLMEIHRMEAVGRMTAGIAHDFRGIIGAALGFAELMRRVPQLPAQADHYAQRIIDALERGRELTHQLMSFGKDDAVSPRVLDVRELLETLSNMFRAMLGNAIGYQVVMERPTSRVFIDASQLERTLLNLVLNARDAMSAGGTLTIDIGDDTIEDDDGEQSSYVAIRVADTGIGMDEATRSSAFKPFFSTKGDHGTGLGLAIVDQIVSHAGGRVRIESEPGRGTSVIVYLPRIAGAM
jgi:two-component system cell cycle sensor histidine kinase/response regulator CckA